MNKKVWAILLLGILVVAPLFAYSVRAQIEPMSPLKTIIDLFAKNFGFLISEDFRLQISRGDADAIIYMKILLALLVILPLFYLFRKVFGDKNKGIAGILALVVGIMSVVLIPMKTVFMLASAYSAVATLLLFALPVIAVFFLYRFIKQAIPNETVSAILEILGAIIGLWFTYGIQDALSELAKEQPVISQVLDQGWVVMLIGVFCVMGFFGIMKLFTHFGGHPETLLGRRLGGTYSRLGGRGGELGGVGAGGPVSLPTTPGAGGGEAGAAAAATVTEAERRLADVEQRITQLDQALAANLQQAGQFLSEETEMLPKLKQALSELSESIKNLGGLYNSAREYAGAAGALPQRVQEYNDRITNKKQEVQGKLNDALKGIEAPSRLEDFSNSLKGIRSAAFPIEEGLKSIKNEIDSLKALAAALTKINLDKIDELEKIAKESNVDNSGAIGDLNNKIDQTNGVKETITQASDMFNMQDMLFKDLITKITRCEESIEKFKSDVTNNKKELTNAIENQFNKGEFDNAVKSVNGIGEKVGGMQTHLNEISNWEAGIKEDETKLAPLRAWIPGFMDYLNKQIKSPLEAIAIY